MPLKLIVGDITEEITEAIVNAANSHLAGGGGVDGAIHRRGGPEIMAELKTKYKNCPTGSAVITTAGKLKAKYVIHAVGPVYSGRPNDSKLLASAYQKSLELCSQYQIKTVSFPSISTGAYHYPVKEAASVALKTVSDYLKDHPEIKLARFVLFDESTHRNYQDAFESLSNS